MPPDTIYIPGQTGPPPQLPDTLVVLPNGDTVSLPDSYFGTGGYEVWKLQQELQKRQEEERQANNSDGNIFFLLFIAFLFVAIGWERVAIFLGWKQKRIKKIASKVVNEKGTLYDSWLQKYNPYYASLSYELKQRFLFRVVSFMKSKEFRFHSMVEEEYIPVLISGAAVQLTFGLCNYLMDHFPVIHIMRKEYILNIDNETYYGHVSGYGIHVSWRRFQEGYSDYDDSVNVGLHEMAHALSFDAYLGYEDRHDRSFKERLKDFSAEGKPIFRAMRKGASHILDDYATENFDEFWAVSVETFFENPAAFKQTMPDLYGSLVELLNQDPLTPGKIIDEKLAGLAN
jgi:Mlc titration factor MtfA (ptsG expression regulator)